MALLLETTLGDLVIDLDVEGSPELCKNFLQLTKARFYTSTLVFSVVPNRFSCWGDPIGDGSGGTCIYGLIDRSTDGGGEQSDYHKSSRRFLSSSVGRRLTPAECRERGRVVATGVNDIPDTIGSQFMITLGEGPDQSLDGLGSKKSSFLSLGRVVEDDRGVLDAINAAYVDPRGRPYADIRIRRALVVHDPFGDMPGLEKILERSLVVRNGRVVSSPSPERPLEEAVEKRISVEDVGLDGDMDSDDEAVLKEKLKREQEEGEKRADKSRAVVLEMLGDLPDADISAPEDVLFICKLNPETVDEDLELIFSRFDEKVKVEIIRDPDTGQSLQYAFAEFSTKKAAEEAYFKMNNALVDDRRIKVDFSQSVSKIWDKYNQRMRMPKPTGRDGSFQTRQPQQDSKPPAQHERKDRKPNRRDQQVHGRYGQDDEYRPSSRYQREPYDERYNRMGGNRRDHGEGRRDDRREIGSRQRRERSEHSHREGDRGQRSGRHGDSSKASRRDERTGRDSERVHKRRRQYYTSDDGSHSSYEHRRKHRSRADSFSADANRERKRSRKKEDERKSRKHRKKHKKDRKHH